MTEPNEEREWVVPIEDRGLLRLLRQALDVFECTGESDADPNRFIKALVERFNGLRIEIFSREHPPPHFRVSFDGDSANYRISDCEQLNGGLTRYKKVIENWHARNKETLIEAWNRRRPTDCPVGEYREG